VVDGRLLKFVVKFKRLFLNSEGFKNFNLADLWWRWDKNLAYLKANTIFTGICGGNCCGIEILFVILQ